MPPVPTFLSTRRFNFGLMVFVFSAYPPLAFAESYELPTVEVTATQSSEQTAGAPAVGAESLAKTRATTSDSARLLQDVPGVSLYGAGGVSSLPAIHGLADDRVRVLVDGMDLIAACPNHMNSALSYIDPAQVGSATVFAGITPVSVGGDSIGGTIQVNSVAPEFAGEETLKKGQAGVFYRSNGKARGGNVAATLATQQINISYSAARAKSDNYHAGAAFKPAGPGTEGSPWLDGDEVGSSAYDSFNQNMGLALKQDGHLLQLNAGRQHLSFEGFPNQRMDMTGNDSTQLNLRYSGQYGWGVLEARLFDQQTDHAMNMGPDRFTYGALGMPMLTEAKTTGAQLQGNYVLSERDILRAGIEFQKYTLYDWWPQAGGSMGPNTFWNIDFGKRDRIGVYGEWEAFWNPEWVSQLGIRSDTVKTDASPVQGYNNGEPAAWGNDAAAFNALDRQRTDHNWDLTALARYSPDATQTFDMGYARKSRSPNLYQRYPWSTNAMADLMNNFVGDGNGYIGNVDLKPEVAHTLSGGGDWHDAKEEQWKIKATSYFTYVRDYIDARRCDFGGCGHFYAIRTTGFVHLQYVNQSARLYGLDLSGQLLLNKAGEFGSFTATGLLNYVRGENSTTGDNLYNMMPPNLKLALIQHLGMWSNTAEVQLVGAKTHVSQVRDEMKTGAYSLFNLRSSCEWEQVRLDIGIENVFNKHYSMPLGGAYVGQGDSMTTDGPNAIAWGVPVPVPGMGRSINASLNAHF